MKLAWQTFKYSFKGIPNLPLIGRWIILSILGPLLIPIFIQLYRVVSGNDMMPLPELAVISTVILFFSSSGVGLNVGHYFKSELPATHYSLLPYSMRIPRTFVFLTMAVIVISNTILALTIAALWYNNFHSFLLSFPFIGFVFTTIALLFSLGFFPALYGGGRQWLSCLFCIIILFATSHILVGNMGNLIMNIPLITIVLILFTWLRLAPQRLTEQSISARERSMMPLHNISLFRFLIHIPQIFKPNGMFKFTFSKLYKGINNVKITLRPIIFLRQLITVVLSLIGLFFLVFLPTIPFLLEYELTETISIYSIVFVYFMVVIFGGAFGVRNLINELWIYPINRSERLRTLLVQSMLAMLLVSIFSWCQFFVMQDFFQENIPDLPMIMYSLNMLQPFRESLNIIFLTIAPPMFYFESTSDLLQKIPEGAKLSKYIHPEPAILLYAAIIVFSVAFFSVSLFISLHGSSIFFSLIKLIFFITIPGATFYLMLVLIDFFAKHYPALASILIVVSPAIIFVVGAAVLWRAIFLRPHGVILWHR